MVVVGYKIFIVYQDQKICMWKCSLKRGVVMGYKFVVILLIVKDYVMIYIMFKSYVQVRVILYVLKFIFVLLFFEDFYFILFLVGLFNCEF